MSSHRVQAGSTPRRGAVAVSAGIALLAGSVALAGCSTISKIHGAIKTAEGNSTVMSSFTQKLSKTANSPFQVTYVTTGSTPATVTYAVDPPTNVELSDQETSTPQNGATSFRLIENSAGTYSCTPPPTANGGTSGSSTASKSWTCTKFSGVSAATEKSIASFYTPSHWVTFLQDFSLAAGFAGDKVTQSSMTVNGFAMSCVDFTTPGENGLSTICSTSAGILGYVKVVGDSTSFEIKSYSSSPASSDFQLPAGAKVTTITVPTTTAPPSTT